MASYEDDAKHPLMVPTLLYMLNRDLEDLQFTTKEGGLAASILAETCNNAANVGIVATTAVGVQRGLGALDTIAARRFGLSVGQTALGEKAAQTLATKAAGRALVGVGAAVDGFLSFSDGQFMHDDQRQLATRTASPIALGAGFGSFFGPIGTAVGGAAGAAGEAGGAFYYTYHALPAEIEADWKKRGVRDSIRMAQQGFVFPDNHERVRTRGPLSAEEDAAIEAFAREALLNRLFNPNPQVGFTSDQLKTVGFKVADEKASAEDRRKIDTHNWEHAKDLLEGRLWYNPVRWGYGGYIDDLRSKDEGLANRFENIHKECRREFEKLYRTSMQARYTQKGDGLAINREFNVYIREVTFEFEKKFKKEDEGTTDPQNRADLSQRQWDFLTTKFPQLGLIMSNEYDRQNFVNNFNSSLGNREYSFDKYAIWKDAARSEAGRSVLIAAGLVEQLSEDVSEHVASFSLPKYK
jgi:hypothetical protein